MATAETAPTQQSDKTVTIEVNAHKVKMPAGRSHQEPSSSSAQRFKCPGATTSP